MIILRLQSLKILKLMFKMESVRWAFNTRLWTPSKGDWITALSYIQPEEKERIGKFVFKKDAKSSMAGRLMLRKLATEVLGLSWSCTAFKRTDKGRPYLVNSLPEKLGDVDFNVSHQGDWAVLAANTGSKVGVDVMKIEYVGGKSIPAFFHTMRRQFTHDEWQDIHSFPEEKDQLMSFYRHWCLKEGVLKALGVGIGFELQRVSFILSTPVLKANEITTDTEVMIDGKLDDWHFEETMLDPNHCVAVAHKYKEGVTHINEASFKCLNFDDLICSGEALTASDEKSAEEFINKSDSPW